MRDYEKERAEGIKELESGFMTPKIYKVSNSTEAEELIGLESGLDLSAGFYCRLSANGFMDCTDWHGAFETLAEAQDCLVDLYAMD